MPEFASVPRYLPTPSFELLISARRYKVMYSLYRVFKVMTRETLKSYLSLSKKIIISVNVSDKDSS